MGAEEPQPEPEPAQRSAEPAAPWWLGLQTGDTLHLEHSTGFRLALIVDCRGDSVLLARPAQPYHRLLADRKGELHWRVTLGHPGAMWVFGPAAGAEQQPSCVIGMAKPGNAVSTHLGFGQDGALAMVPLDARAAWRRLTAPPPSPAAAAADPPAAEGRGAALAAGAAGEALDAFRERGFAFLPALIPAAACGRALRLINHHLGSAESRQFDPDGRGGLGAEFFEAPQQEQQVLKLGGLAIHPLLRGGVLAPPQLDAIAAAVGLPPGAVQPAGGAQLALRFPLPPLGDGQPGASEAEVLDGLLGRLEWHDDLAKYNNSKSFDLVVGVFLSPVPTAACGPLWVQPRSHKRPASESDPAQTESDRGAAAAVATVPAEARTPVLAEEGGGVVVFHRRLLHAGGPVLADNVRYALYYRLRVDRAVVAERGAVGEAGGSWEARFA